MEDPSKPEKLPSVSLLRRLTAIFYDSLLLFSVLFFVAALAYPITHGQVSFGYQIYLLAASFLYFAWQWIHGGQTLGMKAWRIQLVSSDGKPVTWQQTGWRFFIAIVSWLALGIGFLWAVFDKQQRAWHDWGSDTRIVLRPK